MKTRGTRPGVSALGIPNWCAVAGFLAGCLRPDHDGQVSMNTEDEGITGWCSNVVQFFMDCYA